ncbi:MAG TPA: NADH-ubiquinone oxidoreductase-F iron-sulfur binding region domain-containing protein [Candidatus Binatia bacterium]|jgi:NADH-quinone oxidoreductase subunit F
MEGILFPRGVVEGKESLDAYRARGGYQALDKALKQMSPRDVLEEIDASGLRGRGGAGFPTGKKWTFTADTPETPRYVILNGGEDEPGSKKDRLLMENVPHLILEGVVLAAYAVGASKAYLYINADYKDAIQAMEEAVAEAKKSGYVGDRIGGKDFSLEIEFFPAPHDYVAGEDSAVIEVIEGKKPLPRQKPPFPATAGLYAKPTAVNNVETLANVAPIILRGASWYRGIGTAESAGTMVFSLNEEVKRPGVYELPFGTPLRHLIENCGGGTRDGKKIKAVLPGGPSSAFLSGDQLDVALDHNSVRAAGSSIGCGVIGIVTEDQCIVEEALRIAEFFAKESCGQCPACRMETNTLAMLLRKIQQGQGQAAMLDQFGKVIAFNKGKGFCSLINMPGPPIESAVRLFRADFDAHLAGKCPSTS